MENKLIRPLQDCLLDYRRNRHSEIFGAELTSDWTPPEWPDKVKEFQRDHFHLLLKHLREFHPVPRAVFEEYPGLKKFLRDEVGLLLDDNDRVFLAGDLNHDRSNQS